MSDGLEAALAEAAGGHGPETVALMRLLMEASSEAAARERLETAILAQEAAGSPTAASRLRRLQSLWSRHPQAWSVVRSTIAEIEHDRGTMSPDHALRYWAERFDRLAANSPEASVALYSLGSPDLLTEATEDIVTRMQEWGLLGRDREALDLGCGIGRFLLALAPRLRIIQGLDISARMVAEARRRCLDYPNVQVGRSEGRDLRSFVDESLDLVLAADVFPYLVETGGDLAAAHVLEFARVLRPGGAALILNYSYRGDPVSDRSDVTALAESAGFWLERDGTREFRTWDGLCFLLRKPAS